MQQKEIAEDIVIVGAGLAGLAVALGLHRKGVRSLVLESSPALRASGFAFSTWRNAFRALDALGVGDKIRKLHLQAQGLRVFSSATGELAQELDFTVQGKRGPHEFRCVRRDVLLQALEEELPRGTIRYSSKIVSIEEDGDAKILHLADGPVLTAKVLIGCDGVNSVVAKWLGLATPSFSGRTATRGLAHYPDGHGFEPKFLQFIVLGDAGARGSTEKERIESGLRKYAGIRWWRSVELIGTAYVIGFIQQSDNAIIGFLRDKFLTGVLARRLLKMSDYDCGTL